MRRPKVFKYGEIKAGDTFSFEKVLSQDDVIGFARLTGDRNPLHVDPDYGKKTMFKGSIVHGMLAASLFSTLLGMLCPGKYNLYVSQTLQFRNALKPGTPVVVEGKVTRKIDAMRLVAIATTVRDRETGMDYVTGEAHVKILEVDAP